MNKGWLINDTLTCIPGTKTFWHDLLEWIPNLEDKCNGRTPFHILANNIENDAKIFGLPDYIIRNASYFRKINLPVKTISLLQDYIPNDTTQLSVCNDSDLVVFNSPYTKALYQDKITANSIMIPLGVDFEKFKPLNTDFCDELGILPNSILFIGANNENPKGFDIMTKIIENTDYNFCLVMKDNFVSDNPRVKVFNKINHDMLVKVINSCKLLVCTSRVETLHLAGVEAAACNLPLVTSNVGIYYGLEKGEWGYNTMSYNFLDFITGIDYVISNYSSFKPRETFLKMGLDTETCKSKWLDIVKNL
jgi:glycosyltransferase involved in cell wall biosynthesis